MLQRRLTPSRRLPLLLAELNGSTKPGSLLKNICPKPRERAAHFLITLTMVGWMSIWLTEGSAIFLIHLGPCDMRCTVTTTTAPLQMSGKRPASWVVDMGWE